MKNPDSPMSPREELEMRLTALLMGELPPEQADALRAQIAKDPRLAALHRRLQKAVELLREASVLPEQPAAATPAQLSAERREKLFAHFKTTPKGVGPILSPIVPMPKRRDWSWVIPMGLAAAVLIVIGGSLTTTRFSNVVEPPDFAASGPADEKMLSLPPPPGSQPGLQEPDLLRRQILPDYRQQYASAPPEEAPTPRFAAAGNANTLGIVGGTKVDVPAGTTNPIQGRIAFWADDETSKVNLDTDGGNVALTKSGAGTLTISPSNDFFKAPPANAPGDKPIVTMGSGQTALRLPLGGGFENGRDFDTGISGNDIRVSQLMTEAQGFFDTGRLEMAKKRSEQVLNLDRSNIAARELKEGIDQRMSEYGISAYNETRSDAIKQVDVAWQRPIRRFNIPTPAPTFTTSNANIGNTAIALDGTTVTGSGGITLSGTISPSEAKPTTTLSGTNTYSGGTTINGGTLSINSGSMLAMDPVVKDTGNLSNLGNTVITSDPGNAGLGGNLAPGSNGERAAGSTTRTENQPGDVLGMAATTPTDGLAKNTGKTSARKDFNDDQSAAVPAAPAAAPAARPAEPEALTNKSMTEDPRIVALTAEVQKAQAEMAEAKMMVEAAPDRAKENKAKTATAEKTEMSRSAMAARPANPIAATPAPTAKADRRSAAVDELSRSEGAKIPGKDAPPAPAKPATLADVKAKEGKALDGVASRVEVAGKLEKAPADPAQTSQNLVADLRLLAQTSESARQILNNVPIPDDSRAVPSTESNRISQQAGPSLLREMAVASLRDDQVKALLHKYGYNVQQETEPKTEDAAPKPQAPAAVPQPEVATSANAFSTFSLNVSDVAFKLAGASLEKGRMPEPATVRSEEFINAFDYRDPEPAAGAPLAFMAERARYPFAQNRDLLRLSVKTAAAGRQPGRALNLVLLLDNSGSMERADRVRILREALRVLGTQLQPQDKLSVVTFARTPRLWADGVAGDKAAEVTARVGEITPQGGTNLDAALDLGYQTALRHYQAGGISRVVLITDGAANLGDVNADALKQKVEGFRKQGIALDCFGVGWEGYNDSLLETLSRNGDGRYGFINSPEEAVTEFAGQLAGALRVAASDVKVQVEFNPRRVTAYRQIGYAKHQLTKEQFRDNKVDAAEIGAAESGNALYVVEVNSRGEGDLATVRVRFKVPGTSDYREHEWSVPFTSAALPLEQASPALRLAGTASAFAEWLVASPYAGEVTTDRLLGLLNGVPAVYGADPRPKKLEWMIRQARSVSGR